MDDGTRLTTGYQPFSTKVAQTAVRCSIKNLVMPDGPVRITESVARERA